MKKAVSIITLMCFLVGACPMTVTGQDIEELIGNLDDKMMDEVIESGAPAPPELTMPGNFERSSKITLELKGVDILDVLKILSKKSGLNIIAGRNVRGPVTLFLQDVDVWDALKIILETSDLAYEKKGDIIKVITKADYEALYGRTYSDKKATKTIQVQHARAAVVGEILAQVKSKVGRIVVDEATNSIILIDTPRAIKEMEEAVVAVDKPMATTAFRLKYADAEDIESKLSEVVTPNVGVIKVDMRTNTVIVTDVPSKIKQISDIIRTFDEKPRQVLIEAKIVEVTLDDEYALGIDWDIVFDFANNKPFAFGTNDFGGLGATSNILTSTDSTDVASFTINSSSDDFSAVMRAIQGMGKTNTLSNPRVLVLNNEEATIAVATREPFVSQTVVQGDNTATTADNVEFVDVGVTLSVTPSITHDNYIVLAVKPEVSTAGDPLTLSSNSGSTEETAVVRTRVPVVTSQEIETKVIVQSGKTLVLGGLIQDAKSAQIRKLPVLGDIPFLGAAFRNKTDDFRKTELVMFITPHIIQPEISTEETPLYLNPDGTVKEFNEVGGRSFEFMASQRATQPYMHVDEEPFWEKNESPASHDNRSLFTQDYRTSRDNRDTIQDAMLESVRKSYEEQSSSLPSISGAGAEVGVRSRDAYAALIESRLMNVLQNYAMQSGLSGPVRIDLTVSKNGFLRQISVNAGAQPDLNTDLILAVNNVSPYPAVPDEVSSGDVSLSFDFVL